jgi:CRISPR/Cas system-associated protein Cas5 (RAMP superfamily)
MKVKVRGESVLGSFVNNETGQSFKWKTQAALLYLNGDPVPTKFNLNLNVDEPDYEEGPEYEFHEDSFVTDERGRLKFARNIVLRKIPTAQSK